MAVTLLESSSTFRKSVTACAAALRPYNVDLMAEFSAEKGWSKPGLAMVGLVAVQIGLVDVLREEYGITPAGMLGHSAGEAVIPARCDPPQESSFGTSAALCPHTHIPPVNL
jgi:fatty acid synthase